MTPMHALTMLRKAKKAGVFRVPPIRANDGTDVAVEFHVMAAVATGLLAEATSLHELLALADLGFHRYIWGKITLDELNAALRSILPNAGFVAEEKEKPDDPQPKT